MDIPNSIWCDTGDRNEVVMILWEALWLILEDQAGTMFCHVLSSSEGTVDSQRLLIYPWQCEQILAVVCFLNEYSAFFKSRGTQHSKNQGSEEAYLLCRWMTLIADAVSRTKSRSCVFFLPLADANLFNVLKCLRVQKYLWIHCSVVITQLRH